MNPFKLRLPTIQDVERIWNSLSEQHTVQEIRDILHWGGSRMKYPDNRGIFFGEFHLSDEVPGRPGCHACAGWRDVDGRYASTEHAPAAFRPVLEAWGSTDLSCINDGTIIHMGAFMLGGQNLPIPGPNEVPPIWPERNALGGPLFALNPYAEGEKTSIGWIKLGNILMADRCVLSRVTYQQLDEQRITTGIELKMPFDKAVARMFYDQALQQPRSRQREVGEVMHKFYIAMDENTSPAPAPDLLYNLAEKTHAYWLSPDSEPLTMDEIVKSVVELLEHGVDAFPMKEKNAKAYHFENFSPEAVKVVLQSCNSAVFSALVDHKAKDNIMSQLANSGDPNMSPAGQALFALRIAEKTVAKKSDSLDARITGAAARKTEKPVDQNPHEKDSLERG